MEEKMFEVRRTITSFEPGEGDYLEHFQCSTMLFPIVTPPLSMESPAGIDQAPSPMPVPKPQKKRVIRTPQVKKLTAKRSKVNPPTPIVDLIIEVENPISATAIVEEILATTSTVVHPSWELSPQTASTFATMSKILPFSHR